METNIYNPWAHQEALHNQLRRCSVVIAHRRFGKTSVAVNELIRCVRARGGGAVKVHYIAPMLSYLKVVVWPLIRRYSGAVECKFYQPRSVTDIPHARVEYPDGGELNLLWATEVERALANHPEAFDGVYSDYVVLDEYDYMAPSIWEGMARKMVSARDGRALLIGSMRGRNGNLWAMYRFAEGRPDWYRGLFPASETGVVPVSALQNHWDNMTPQEYDLEFECGGGKGRVCESRERLIASK